jgi:argininosuccinate lyase
LKVISASAVDLDIGYLRIYYLQAGNNIWSGKMSNKKSWEQLLNGGPDKLLVDFVESLSYDTRLYKYDIVASIAHAQMLCEQKLISKSEFKLEDIHMAIESALVKKVGTAGKKLHTGRSRNDQVATDLRLWMRDEIDSLQTKIIQLQKELVKKAGKYAEDVMAGYTY